jgi:two-component system response regulator GlrR
MSDQARILLVDDDAKLLRLLSIRLTRAGFDVTTAASGKQALTLLPQIKPRLIITDARMDGMDGVELFEKIRSRHPTLPTIILTAHGTIPDAVDAAQRGVFAYMTKPFDASQLIDKIQHALDVGGEGSAGNDARAERWRSEILTCSAAMETLLLEAHQVARSHSSVMILGASGTGKELLAQAIHKASNRAKGPFVGVNCTALPETLFESELFGHRKGSFTGANEDREGLLVAAHGGTLLLDEVGDMPLPFQAKLLRVLQEHEVRPVGASESTPIDVRIISATHHDLEQAMEARQFRDDLYYRLNVVTLEMPSLADRREDIPLLASSFLAGYSATAQAGQRKVAGFSREAMERLVSARWPGNIRQLRNVVEQCVVLSTSPMVSDRLVKRALRSNTQEMMPFATAREQFEFDYLVKLLQATQGNVSRAARLAQRNRSEFYKRLHKHGLDPKAFRSKSE